MGCHGNGEITYSGNEFIHGNKNSSYSVDPREQFGTHENLSWGGGCMVGPTGPRPIVFEKKFFLVLTVA